MLDALAYRCDLQDLLLLLHLQLEMGSHAVDQAAWVLNAGERCHGLRRHLLAQIDELLELAHQGAYQHFAFPGVLLDFLNELNLNLLVAIQLLYLLKAGTLLAFHQHLDGAIGQLQQLQDGGKGSRFVELLGTGVIVRRIALGYQHHLFLAQHGGLQGFDGLAPANEEGNDHMGENHHITQWQ